MKNMSEIQEWLQRFASALELPGRHLMKQTYIGLIDHQSYLRNDPPRRFILA